MATPVAQISATSLISENLREANDIRQKIDSASCMPFGELSSRAICSNIPKIPEGAALGVHVDDHVYVQAQHTLQGQIEWGQDEVQISSFYAVWCQTNVLKN